MATQRSQAPLKPRKKPTQGRAGRTVTAILDAAAHILERDGLGGYNTNAIAERAGVSIGSLYQYFGGKDAITAALIEREGEQRNAEITQASECEDADEALDGMIAAVVRHQLRRPVLARLLDFEERRLLDVSGHAPQQASAYVQALIERRHGPHPRVAVIATDLIVMTRALCDLAGESRESDAADLQARIGMAIEGYLREHYARQDAAGA